MNNLQNNKLYTINDILKKFNIQITSKDIKAFSFIFIIGYLTHLYIYTNQYLGHDASTMYGLAIDWDIRTGRYIGTYVKHLLHGSLQAPALVGLITTFFLSFSSIIVCRLLKIENILLIILVGAVLISWPTVTSGNCYMYMSSQFSVAVVASCLAAFMANEIKYGIFAAVPLIVISMACYQSYWGLCASLLLICLIRDILTDKTPIKAIFLKALKFALMLAAGFLFYYGIWMGMMAFKGLEFPNYRNISSMGFNSIGEFFSVVINAYTTVVEFFLIPNLHSYYPDYMVATGWLSIIFSLVLLIYIIKTKKIYKNILSCGLLSLFFILLPITMNCAEIFSKAEAKNVLSYFAFTIPFIMFPMLVSLVEENLNKLCFNFVFLVSVFTLSVSIANGIYGANATYIHLDTNYRVGVSQVTQYLSRIQSEKDYQTTTPIVIIGATKGSYYKGFEWIDDITGCLRTSLTYDRPRNAFFNMLSPGINIIPSLPEYEKLEAVKALEPFPSNNCITWHGDVLILKLS